MVKRSKNKSVSVKTPPSAAVSRHYGTRAFAIRVLEFISVFMIFLMPLKFGGVAMLPEAPLLLPENIPALIIIQWPSAYLYFISGLLLMAALIIMPPVKFRKTDSLIYAGSWVLLALVSLVGAVNASSFEYVIYYVVNFFSMAAFAVFIWRLLENNPELLKFYIGAIVFGTFASCASGAYQYFIGFKETLNYAYEQELKSGMKIVEGNMQQRLNETRVFADFSLCNSYAAHLILTIPIVFWAVWHFCSRVEETKQARMLFVPLAVLCPLIMLWLTGSRAAILAFTGALFLTVLIMIPSKKLKMLLLAILPFLAAGAALCIYFYRGYSSVEVRVDYNIAALKMFIGNFWTGTGWGDFFHEYMRIKTIPTDEAPHDPHCFITAFASQAGITGLLAAAFLLFYPVYRMTKHLIRDLALKKYLTLNLVTLAAFGAWVIHSMADINMQVPGTCITAAVLCLCTGINTEKETVCSGGRRNKIFNIIYYIVSVFVILITLAGSYRILERERTFYVLQQLCDPRFKNSEDLSKISLSEVEYALKQCSDAFPYSAFTWGTAGDFMVNRHEYERAEEYYKEAAWHSPERASFYHRLFVVQTLMGKHREAEQNYKKMLELFPLNPYYREKRLPGREP